jgi:hypothetical protein
MNDEVRSLGLTKEEMFAVARRFKPNVTQEEFDQWWAEMLQERVNREANGVERSGEG